MSQSSARNPDDDPASRTGTSRVKWAVGLLVIAALVAGWFLLPVRMWVEAFQGWIGGLGSWGWLAFLVVYVVSTVLMLPASVLTLAAGLAFGLGIGFPLVVVSATLGATLAFLVSRYVLHDRVDAFVSRQPRFEAVRSAVGEGGWKIIGLLRLSPVLPFNLQNYFYGITDVSLAHYVPATFFGIMPGTLLYVYLGSAGKLAAGSGGDGVLKWAFFAVGLIVTLGVAVFVTKKARSILSAKGLGSDGPAHDPLAERPALATDRPIHPVSRP